MTIPRFRRRHALPISLGAASLVTVALAVSATASASAPVPAGRPPADDAAIAPHPGSHGYFVEEWASNTTSTPPAENAAVSVLSGMSELWTPGAEWNTGTPVDPAVLDSNIAQAVAVSNGATDAEQERAYVIDRRHQNYTAAEGLGAYRDAFAAAVNLGTTIPDEVPAEAATRKFDDRSNSNGVWADAVGELGPTVQLVNDIRNHAASSNPSKNYYQYARPWRWSADVDVPPYAEPLKKPLAEASSDGGFPSGHTNAGHLAANGLAYAFPQQFDQLLLKTVEIGDSRIEVGMHSPLDVMGGRILSTAITAGALNDPALAGSKERALAAGQTWIASQDIEPDVVDHDAALATYTEYLTYGFEQTGDPGEPVRVPKGAEALIETRLPYLTPEQRRWVLRSTGLESGYPLNDDAEGWGRINLLAAANGYAAFDTDVVVTMDAADGGFSAADEWKNDIDGAGELTKAGSGTLTLSGSNRYTGDTKLVAGGLVAGSPTAFGRGSVRNVAGELGEEVSGEALRIGGHFWQGEEATLSLTAGDGGAAAMRVAGTAVLEGSLSVGLPAERLPKRIPLLQAHAIHGEFAEVTVEGAPAGTRAKLEQKGRVLYLVLGR